MDGRVRRFRGARTAHPPKTSGATYRGDWLNAQKMPPIGWKVDEIILMESIVGKTTHVDHGRWPLCGDA